MSTMPLQFNASQWGILIRNDVDRNVYAETDIFFNWIIISFPSLVFFCQLKFCVPPHLFRSATLQPPFHWRPFIYIGGVVFPPSRKQNWSPLIKRSCRVQPRSESFEMTCGLTVGDSFGGLDKDKKGNLITWLLSQGVHVCELHHHRLQQFEKGSL